MLEAEILKNVVLHSVATALASIVLPVPEIELDKYTYRSSVLGDKSPYQVAQIAEHLSTDSVDL